MSEQGKGSGRRSPLLRWILLLVGIVVAVVVVAVIAYSAFQSSRNMPISVVIYPDARQVANTQLATGHDRLRYVSTSPAEEVGQFYVQQLGGENCTRLDNSGGEASAPAFAYRCMVDGSSFFVTQYTLVIVQPGTGDFAGQTLIDMERVWGQ